MAARSGYQPRPDPMTRKSIEAACKYFVWAMFAFFIFVVIKVLGMMGVV